MPKYIVAITGASGVIYGIKLASELIANDCEVHLILSEPAGLVLEQELGWVFDQSWDAEVRRHLPEGKLYTYMNSDIGAGIASGSFLTEGMIIIPCTMSTLASVAHGMSNNLIERAADVMLKERRPLVLVPRETPLSSVHLRNMLTLSDLGVAIVPAMPAFYHHPSNIDDMIDFVVGKALDVMKIPNNSFLRYE